MESKSQKEKDSSIYQTSGMVMPAFPLTGPAVTNPIFPGNPVSEKEIEEIRAQSQYHEGNKAAPDNNMFFEDTHNPLSSKGD